MSVKPKNTTPLWKNRLLDWLRFSTIFEAKVNLNVEECMEMLATVLPGIIMASDWIASSDEYVFEVDKNNPRQRFSLTKMALYGRRDVYVYLVGELKEEPNLEVTTITAKIYPDVTFVMMGLIIVTGIAFVTRTIPDYGNESIIMSLCLPGFAFLLFTGVTLFIALSNFRDKQVIKTYFLTRIAPLDETKEKESPPLTL